MSNKENRNNLNQNQPINLTYASNLHTSNMQTMITQNITRHGNQVNQTTGTGFVTALETQT